MLSITGGVCAGAGHRGTKLPSGAVRIRRTALNEWLRGLEDDPKEHAA